MHKALGRLLVGLILIVFLSGCQSLSFYSQSVVGHSRLMLSRQPLDEAIATANPELVEKLQLSIELRQFAKTELDLPLNRSYTTYVPLENDYPVWVVIAAPQLSLTPKSWCYLVIGCAAYRGYYSKQAAMDYARQMQIRGWDTHVAGASAYSTLGWFADPLLPSMMRGSNAEFAELLFHELAHQRLYIKGNSSINEAMASVVGEQGTVLWLAHRKNELEAYKLSLLAHKQFTDLIVDLRTALRDLYAKRSSKADKLVNKEALFEQFRYHYRVLKESKWHGKGFYDGWVNGPLNNAKVAAFSTYTEHKPKFERLLKMCDNDFKRFFENVHRTGGKLDGICE